MKVCGGSEIIMVNMKLGYNDEMLLSLLWAWDNEKDNLESAIGIKCRQGSHFKVIFYWQNSPAEKEVNSELDGMGSTQ